VTSRIQTNRFTATGARPPSTRPVGELAINFADNQISVTDPTPAARDILPVRFHSATAAYLTNDIVRQGTGLYQAKANIPAHAFSAIEWNQFLTNAQGDARWLPLIGGTLTGLLTLSGPPTSNLHAATKLYVDTADLTKVPLAGGTMTGFLTLSGAPTSNLHAATKLYVDGQVSASAALYLPLTGGTLTGNLTINNTLFFSTGGMSLNVSTGFSIWTFDASNYELIYTRANGLLQYRRGDGVELWSVNATGGSKVNGPLTVASSASIGGNGITYTGVPSNNHVHAFGWDGAHTYSFVDGINEGALATVAELADHLPLSGGTLTGPLTINSTLAVNGTIGSNSNIAALSDIFARGGHYYFGAADQAVLNTTAAGTSLRFSADGWALSWNASNGTLAFFNNASVPLFTVDAAGNGVFHGTVHGTNVLLLEDQINLLQARIAALEGFSP